ncbi:MAG TPA: glycosyltransferase family 1 protein [Sphingobacteriaceae bacterium]
MAKKLVVGIDIRDLKIAKTGAKTYLEEIVNEFKLNNHGCEIRFLDTPFVVYTGRNKFLKLIEHIRFFFWKQLVLPILAYANKCDVLFCTDYFVPYIQLGYKPIPMFYDAFFYEFSEQCNPLWLKMFNTLGIAAAKRAPYVITLSEYSKHRLVYFTDLDPDKIIPIHLAPKKTAAKETDTGFRPAFKITTPKFILHVGVLEKRKNLIRLVEAFKQIRDCGHTDYSLVLVGQPSSKDELDDSPEIRATIEREQLQDFVMMHGYATDDELAYFYTHASLYVFPSLNEGFGLPVLEAFHHKLPVLVANNTSLPEVGGDAVLTFDPFNVEDIADKIKQVIACPELQKRMSESGFERLKQFSWEQNAVELVKIFTSAVIKK